MKKFHHDLDEISVLSMLIDAEKSKPRPQKTADVLISLFHKINFSTLFQSQSQKNYLRPII